MAAKRDAGRGAFIVVDREVDRKSIDSRVEYSVGVVLPYVQMQPAILPKVE